jgi:hypothetical protein
VVPFTKILSGKSHTLSSRAAKKVWPAALWPCLLYKIAFPRKAYTIIFLSDFSVPEINASTYEGKSVILIGWGSKNLLGSVSNTLKKIDISVLPQRFEFFFFVKIKILSN